MIRIRTKEGKQKCIQLTWKGVEYAMKVINGNNTVFEVREESFKKGRNGQKRNRCCRLQYCFLINSKTESCKFLSHYT